MFRQLIDDCNNAPESWLPQASEVLENWRNVASGHDTEITKPEELVEFFKIYTQMVRRVEVSATSEASGEPTSFADNKVRIILNTMMKNEQPVMARSIRSALPIIDAICYADTGSTGDVFDILREVVPPSIPLCVEIEPWQNFGFNRTAGLEQTYRFVQRMGWNPKTTFILCIDADMTLTIGADFVKDNLTADCYNLQQHNGSSVYWNNRILKVQNQWRVLGRTHEYYDAKISAHYENLTTLHLEDKNDGMNRADKNSRDIVLLMEDLIDNPKNQRSMFYLGESYRNRGIKDKGDYQKAITYYQRHIATGSWEEEVWYSHYAIGLCYESLGDTANMLKAYMDAYQRRPWRSEPIFHIGNYYRYKDQHWSAMVYLKRASEIPFPRDDMLFVDKTVYNHQIVHEMSISAYYTGDKDAGYGCIQKLLRRNEVPHHIRSQAHYNARFYLKSFPNSQFFKITPISISDPYRPCNPSVVARGTNLAIICRSVNYTQKQARNFKLPEGTDIIDTQNTLMVYQTHPVPKRLSESPIVNGFKSPLLNTCRVRGMEDARVVDLGNGKLAFSCTTLEHTVNNSPRTAWVEFDENKEECQVERISKISGFLDDRVQKNWLPFVKDGEIFFIYGYAPLQILKFNPATSTVKLHREFNIPIHSSDWRGSSGPVLLPGEGQLVLIHEVCDRQEGRIYMHRFVLFNETLTAFRSASDLFYFKNNDGVEMATGMALVDGNIYVTIGIEDCEAWLVKMSVDNVKQFIDGAKQDK